MNGLHPVISILLYPCCSRIWRAVSGLVHALGMRKVAAIASNAPATVFNIVVYFIFVFSVLVGSYKRQLTRE